MLIKKHTFKMLKQIKTRQIKNIKPKYRKNGTSEVV